MKREGSLDEFEKFILQDEFEKVLELAGKLKDQKDWLDSMTSDNQGLPDSSNLRSLSTRPTGCMSEAKKQGAGCRPSCRGASLYDVKEMPGVRRDDEKSHDDFPVENAASFIRRNLAGVDGINSSAISRGKYEITDSLIDETINSLTKELKMCLDLKHRLRETNLQEYISRSHCEVDDIKLTNTSRDISRKDEKDDEDGTMFDEKGEPVSTKFAKWQTDILTNWMIEHREHPFPRKQDILDLAKATNLNNTQIVNWTTNIRKRNLKATVDREKKPHHFLDFVFLSTEREKQLQRKYPQIEVSMYEMAMNEADNGRSLLLENSYEDHGDMQDPYDRKGRHFKHGRNNGSAMTGRTSFHGSIPSSQLDPLRARGIKYSYPRPPQSRSGQPSSRHHTMSFQPKSPDNASEAFRSGTQKKYTERYLEEHYPFPIRSESLADVENEWRLTLKKRGLGTDGTTSTREGSFVEDVGKPPSLIHDGDYRMKNAPSEDTADLRLLDFIQRQLSSNNER